MNAAGFSVPGKPAMFMPGRPVTKVLGKSTAAITESRYIVPSRQRSGASLLVLAMTLPALCLDEDTLDVRIG